MQTILKVTGFLLTMMAFGSYGKFVQTAFACVGKANAGMGLVVAAIFYPVAILLPNVFLWRLFWGGAHEMSLPIFPGCLLYPRLSVQSMKLN